MKAMKTRQFILLTAVVAALAIGLVIVVGARLDRVTEEEIVTRFSQRQLLLAKQTAAAIQSIFDEARRDLLHLTGAPGPARLSNVLGMENEDEIITWRGACEQGFSSYLRSNPNYTQIRYIDAGGQEIVVVDRDGETVRVVPRYQLRSQAEREFFIATQQLDNGEIYVSRLEPALGHGETGAGLLTVCLITPIFDSQGQRAGIIVINLLTDEIRAHIARLTVEEGVDAWVLDERGVEIINVAHPELEGSDAYEYCQQTGDETLVTLAKDMLAGGQGTRIYLWPESMGSPLVAKRLMAYAPIYPAEGQIWSVGLSVPYDTILAAHRQTRTTLLFLGVSTTLITLTGAVLAAQSHRKRTVAEERARRSEELEALREISLAISAQLELDTLLQDIVERGCRLLNVNSGGVHLVDETSGGLQMVVSHGYTRDYTGTHLAPGEGIAGKVLQSGAPLVVDDYHHWEERSPNWEAEPITAVLSMPLKHGEQVIGILNFSEVARARSFDEHDLWLATLFAGQAVIAIENARLYQAEQAARERADTLCETSRVVGSTLELDDVLSLVLRQTKRVLTYDTASILLFANTEPAMAAVAGYEDEELVKTEVPLCLGDSPILQAMARDHHPVVIADVREDKRWIWVFGAEDIRAWVGAPLLVRGEMIGALMVDSTQPGSYTAADGDIAQALANQVAMAIENARLYEETQQRLESLTNLNRASQAITSSLNVKDVLEQIVELAGSVVNSDYTSVILLNEEGEPVLGTENLRDVSPITWRIRRSGGVTRHVLDSGQPVVVDFISDEGTMSPPLRRPDGELIEANPDIVTAGIRSFAAVPIQAREQMMGVLFTHSYQPHAFHGQAPLLTTFANQAAVAIENARLYEQAQQEIAERKRAEQALEWRATQLATVGKVGRQIASVLELDPLLTHIVNLIHEAFDYRYVSILLIDPATGELTLEAAAGYEVELAQALRLRVGEEGICGWVAASGEPLLVGDVSQEPRYYPVDMLPDTRSELTVPIQVKGWVIGVLDVQSAKLDAFDQDDLFTLRMLADQMGVAIENAHLFQAEQEQRELAEALEQAAAAVSSTLEFDQVLDRILEQAKRIVAGDASNVMLVEDGAARPARWRGYERFGAAGFPSTISFSIPETVSMQEMVETGKAIIIPDTTAYPNWIHVPGQEWLRSHVAAPIRVGGVTVGFLNVDGTQPGQFDLADARRLEALAAHAATAIENAGLYRELRNHAGQLEQRVQERTAQLEAQYARLDAILRSASDGIVVTDARGEIIQTNPVAQTWLTKTLSPEDAAHLRETARDLARRAEERPETVLELTGLDLQLNAAPISEPGMEEATAVVGIHDVSHLKALDRVKSRFVSNVSHELRTPVTTIKLYTYLMQTQPNKWMQYLDAITQAADRQAQLVEDILQVSRIDAGRLEIKSRPSALNELTEIAIGNHQGVAQAQGLTLEHHPAEPGPVALVDAQRIMQVLNNLVENAIHYTPEGGRIVVSTGKRETEGRTWATVTVADTGIGIPEKELPHIFERFFRGDKPRLTQIPGTGLGLAIVKEIVELHGGRVTVESKVKEGSTFTVWLPLA